MATRKHTDASPDPSERTVRGAEGMDFTALVAAIRQTHEQSAATARRAVNTALTLRNWVIGGYIHHYELNGRDRAKYGARLITNLANALEPHRIPATDRQRLYNYLAFFRAYPHLSETFKAQSGSMPSALPGLADIFPTPSVQFQPGSDARVRTAPVPFELPAEELLNRLSYSHFELLVSIADPLKRSFYEIECIRGNWSVRALRRQIATLYFERSGMSKDPEQLAALARTGAEQEEPNLNIRDPYVFEFLGLKAKDAVEEAALVNHLREFLLELGHGFCLEAQQKSVAIGRTRGFVDLVFYHRILKCHVLVELKVDEFRHEHLGQLNTYVTWYRRHMMADGDNPPVGLLLCTQKDHALAEYALAAMDNCLFVSKYQMELPAKEDLQRFLEEKRRELG